MADSPKEGGGEGQPDGSLDDRVGRLETGQNALTGKLDEILGMLRGGGGGDGEKHDAPEGTGTSVAHEIRTQLADRDREQAAKDRESATDNRLGALETRLGELAEKPPAPLPRRVEKFMGWT